MQDIFNFRHKSLARILFLCSLIIVTFFEGSWFGNLAGLINLLACVWWLVYWITGTKPEADEEVPKNTARNLYILIAVFVFCIFASSAGLFGSTSETTIGAILTLIFYAVVAVIVFIIYSAITGKVDTPETTSHGSAQFASADETEVHAENSNGLALGKTETGKIIRYDGEAHLLTVAPTRSGKGVGAIIPNLLDYQGSVICIDPKGENANVTAPIRKQNGDVFILDPFQTTNFPSSVFNPMDRIHSENPDLVDDAITLADAIVIRDEHDNHWNEEAASLIEGIIMFVGLHETPQKRHLGTVRELLSLDPNRFDDLMKIMQEQGGLIARSADRFIGKSDREAASVRSTSQRHTKFLDSPRMEQVLCGQSDFRFETLKTENCSVYLSLPPDRMDSYSRWLRLMISEAITAMAREKSTPNLSVLFMLDEFAALGRLDVIERSMGLMAGYGITLWPFVQNIGQLKGYYRDKFQTFIANAGAIQVFGTNDFETAKLFSDMLGQKTVIWDSESFLEDDEITYGNQRISRNLLNPDEIMKLPKDQEIIFLSQENPILARKIRYYDDPEFEGLFDKG